MIAFIGDITPEPDDDEEDDEVYDELYDANPEALAADGFADAYVGYAAPGPGRKALAVYDYEKCIKVLMDRDGMSEEEACEYFEFNVVGSWVGECTPLYLVARAVDS
jgi:hypothetical protein